MSRGGALYHRARRVLTDDGERGVASGGGDQRPDLIHEPLKAVLIGFPVHRADENQRRRRGGRGRREAEVISVDAGRNRERYGGAEVSAKNFRVALGDRDDAVRSPAGARFEPAHFRRLARPYHRHRSRCGARMAVENFRLDIMREEGVRRADIARRHRQRLRIIEDDEIGARGERRRRRGLRGAIGVGMGRDRRLTEKAEGAAEFPRQISRRGAIKKCFVRQRIDISLPARFLRWCRRHQQARCEGAALEVLQNIGAADFSARIHWKEKLRRNEEKRRLVRHQPTPR
ncbi:MAG: hypothetical protein A3E78_10825 [Alphaproteobacteria bacterium RIFCSPHIGHO2_12_FULL_63_12]|nr:MAG: hypothetical protein A3E78_10825 [Alphaproteobacteria bacterium RIFCSPHIGHO2_12_FULL_63_12]